MLPVIPPHPRKTAAASIYTFLFFTVSYFAHFTRIDVDFRKLDKLCADSVLMKFLKNCADEDCCVSIFA